MGCVAVKIATIAEESRVDGIAVVRQGTPLSGQAGFGRIHLT